MTNASDCSIEQLREVRAADVATLTALLGTLIRADAAIGWTNPPSPQEIHDLLTTLIGAGTSEAYVVVARVDNDIVGFGYWRRYSRSTLRPQADLERLAVAANFSGQGIGRALLRELVGTAREAGCEQLTIDFRGDNRAAERLYTSEGFTEYGRLRDFVAPDANRRFDKVFQVLDLRCYDPLTSLPPQA